MKSKNYYHLSAFFLFFFQNRDYLKCVMCVQITLKAWKNKYKVISDFSCAATLNSVNSINKRKEINYISSIITEYCKLIFQKNKKKKQIYIHIHIINIHLIILAMATLLTKAQRLKNLQETLATFKVKVAKNNIVLPKFVKIVEVCPRDGL